MDSVMSWDFPGRLAGCVFISSEHQQYKILDTFHFLGWTEKKKLSMKDVNS